MSLPFLPAQVIAPLHHRLFRRIWLASLLSNFGWMIMAVGAAWAMTQLAPSADMVALVQTALMLPVMLFSLVAGAMADMYDRRRVAITALGGAAVGALALTITASLGALSPHLILGFCFCIGTGMAMYTPSWQASVSEQVPAEVLPQAIALNGISFNIARSFGPAVGGLVVALFGAVAAFGVTALFYLPLLMVLYLWHRIPPPARLPPEDLPRAISSGIRYVWHGPQIRIILTRGFISSVIGGVLMALSPIVARDLLTGGPQSYGLLLGSFGLGAVVGALSVPYARARLSNEMLVRLCIFVLALMIAVLGVSPFTLLSAVAMVVAGTAWMLSITIYNVSIQLSAPRWVAGRTLAVFQASIAGGVAVGSIIWGHVAAGYGVRFAMLAAALAMLTSLLLARPLRMPEISDTQNMPAEDIEDPDVRLGINGRSGPIVVEIEYHVRLSRARAFYAAMQRVQRIRKRTGAYDWALSRDIANPEIWVESYRCPTWLDYLRQRSRLTALEQEQAHHARAYHEGPEPVQVRRRLERPLGSVRWKEESSDTGQMLTPPQT